MSEPVAAASRRTFARLLGAGAAGAALAPWWRERSAWAQVATAVPAAVAAPAGPVRLSSNENPYGPPPAAFDAMRDAFRSAWRYPDEREDVLAEALAALHGVTRDQILLGNGSSQILDLAAAAYTGPSARLVLADPTFEALALYAKRRAAAISRIPLTADHRHDLAAMATAAASGPALLYVCNPNNPTATLTPAAELRALLDRVPPGVTVLVDEAYHHYAEGQPGYESMAPLIAAKPNLMVARTFSKIFGMAGLRCGYAVGNPERIRALREQRPWDSVNLMAIAAAQAALGDKAHIERSRSLNAGLRDWTARELERLGYPALHSAANFVMAELRRDVAPVIAALAKNGVEVGRRFSAMPTHLRVTVGTESDMRAFMIAFRQATAA
jgi:histidinol-phosphate aminotransferase